MRYELVLSSRAEATYLALEGLHLFEVDRLLDQLAEAPASISHRGVSPPFPDRSNYAVCVFDDAEGEHTYRVFFQYDADERRLWVSVIGHQVR